MASTQLQGFRGVSYNPIPQNASNLHGDEVARQNGFRGALVPGVVMSAYLLDPAVRVYGLDALRKGYADVTVHKPLYDNAAFEVCIEAQEKSGYRAALLDAEGVRVAEAAFELGKAPAVLPVRTGAPHVPPREDRPAGTREVLERLEAEGMRSVRSRWDAEYAMGRYHVSLDAQPELVRPVPGGHASFAFLLGATDSAIARNAALGPWLHLQTWSYHLGEVPFGSQIVIESKIAELFERKGHEFVDIDVAAFDEQDKPVLAAKMRCIYKMRGK